MILIYDLYFTRMLLGIGLPESSCRKPAQLRCWQSKSWCGLSQSHYFIDNQPDAMCIAASARVMLLLLDTVFLLTQCVGVSAMFACTICSQASCMTS